MSIEETVCDENNFKFVYFFEELIFDLAEADCVEKGGHLVSITNSNEDFRVFFLLFQRDPINDNEIAWIGLKDVGDIGGNLNAERFEYTDGTVDKSFFINAGETPWALTSLPNDGNGKTENCVIRDNAAGVSGGWNDKNCEQFNSYVCELPCSVVPTNLPTNSPTNLGNNPTISPTKEPTQFPSISPSKSPSSNPTEQASKPPTVNPTTKVTDILTEKPTTFPTVTPTVSPSISPIVLPTVSPTVSPTVNGTSLSVPDNDEEDLSSLIIGLFGLSLLLPILCVFVAFIRTNRRKKYLKSLDLLGESTATSVTFYNGSNSNNEVKYELSSLVSTITTPSMNTSVLTYTRQYQNDGRSQGLVQVRQLRESI